MFASDGFFFSVIALSRTRLTHSVIGPVFASIVGGAFLPTNVPYCCMTHLISSASTCSQKPSQPMLQLIQTSPSQPMTTTHNEAASAKVYLHRDVFDELRAIQRTQDESPRFDLRDLASAALRFVLRQPDSGRLILDIAHQDFARRVGRG